MKNAPNRPPQTKVFSIWFPVPTAIFAVALVAWLALPEGWKDLWPICAGFLVASAILMLLLPISYVFHKKELVCVYFWGYQKHLPWLQVDGISETKEYGKLALNKLYSKVTVHYHFIFRGRSIQHFCDLPNTERIKHCFRKYYTGHIRFEDTPKKRKRWA